MHNNLNIIFNLSSSPSGGESDGLSYKYVSRCSNLHQESVNSEFHDNIHLPAPDLSRGYSEKKYPCKVILTEPALIGYTTIKYRTIIIQLLILGVISTVLTHIGQENLTV